MIMASIKETAAKTSHDDAAMSSFATAPGDEFRTIAEAMPHLVWTARADGTIDFFNRRWIEYTGVDLAEFAQRGKVVGVVHPNERAATIASWKGALAAGASYEQEYRLRCARDGSYRWFLSRAVPVRDDSGRIVRWIGTATDIDDRQRASESLRFMVEVGNVLSNALDVETIASSIARVTAGHFADWCLVTLMRDREYVTAALEHKDRQLLHHVEAYRNRYPVRPADTIARVIAANEPMLIERVLAEQLEHTARDPEHLRLLQLLQMHSVIIVPLSAPEGPAFGALTMVSAESGRLFNENDVKVAQAAAARVAVGIANAKIFEEQRRAAEELRFTGRVNQLLFETPDPWTTMERVARLIARDLADACAVLRLDGDAVRTEIVVHRNRRINAAIAGLRGRRTLRLQHEAALAEQLRKHATIVLDSQNAAHLKQRVWPYLAREMDALDARATVIVPWHAGTATYGALVAYYSARTFDPRDVALLEEIAARASVAVERAETLERERKIATTLQQASLPSLIPKPADLRFDAVYRPAGDEAEVGGDWYDAIELDDGSVVISVGDVTGRGIQAAAIMSKVRHAMGMAPLHERDPKKILDSAGWFLGKRYPDAIVTAFVAVISPDRRTLRFANAGHPLPLLRRGGELSELHAEGLPLGLRHLDGSASSGTVELCDRDLLVLYTDGLIEARRDWTGGEERLREVVKSGLFAASTAPAKLLARSCLPEAVHDDVAILVVTVRKSPAWSLNVDDARAAVDARATFVEFLTSITEDRKFIGKAELIFGELLGNVVRHAPGPVEISVETSEGSITLHVIDSGPPLSDEKRRLPADVLSERGRGLFIVERLAAVTHVEHVRGCGNHVSATISY
jgi:PAS domain S-box-containing protein